MPSATSGSPSLPRSTACSSEWATASGGRLGGAGVDLDQVTSRPALTQTSAIPVPMIPPPTIPTRSGPPAWLGLAHRKAWMPVMAPPTTSAWMSSVPS